MNARMKFTSTSFQTCFFLLSPLNISKQVEPLISLASSSLHPYLSEDKVLLSLSLPLLPLLLLLGVQRLLFDDQPSQRPSVLRRCRRGGWRRGGEPLVLSQFLFRFLRVTLVLPGQPWGAGACNRELVTRLGHDLGDKERGFYRPWLWLGVLFLLVHTKKINK